MMKRTLGLILTLCMLVSMFSGALASQVEAAPQELGEIDLPIGDDVAEEPATPAAEAEKPQRNRAKLDSAEVALPNSVNVPAKVELAVGQKYTLELTGKS